MTTNELRPCPFCGQKPWLFRTDMVQCANKDCFMHDDDDIDLDDWNTRPIEDGLQAEIDRLRTVLTEIDELVRKVGLRDGSWEHADLAKASFLAEWELDKECGQ